MLRISSFAAILLALSASNLFGQFAQQNRILGMTDTGFRSAASNILSRPTVSPYLALTDLNGAGTVDTSRNYFTQVRPRLESQQAQQRQQRSLATLQQNVQQMQSRRALETNQRGIRSTGHPTRFNSYLQYYPGFGRR